MSDYINNNIIFNTSISEDKVSLCVVLPAYNEGLTICNNLLETSKIISDFSSSYRLIAVNDGSSDNTYEQIKKASELDSHISYVTYDKNQGKGAAISFGVKYSNAEYIAFLDSDMELNPIMLKDFLENLISKDADIAIGSKLHPDSELEYPAIRRFLSMGYYIFLKMLFRLKLRDTQTGIKLFKADVIKPICENLSTHGFAFDIEILAKATRKGCKIIEMPIKLQFNRSRTEKSRFSLKVIINIFKETLKVKKALKHFS